MRPRRLVQIILILGGAAVFLLRDTDSSKPSSIQIAGQTIERKKAILGVFGLVAVALGGVWVYTRRRA